jgi:kynureninase
MPMAKRYLLSDVEALDRLDPLRAFRSRFVLPTGVIYLDGNSLGALPLAVVTHLGEVVANQWGEGLIRSWDLHDWIELPARVATKICPLIGAPPGTVVATDSTSVNLFKVLAVALEKRRGRPLVLTEQGNFPTDHYIAEGVTRLMDRELRAVATKELASALGPQVAVLLLTEVNYRTGSRHDMALLTRCAHEAGALVIWDLCHSAGAFPIDLVSTGADFAVGCGYKYLNGGPGAPSFVYVAPEHLEGLQQPLSGWLGHASPFAFAPAYEPAAGIGAMRSGTPPILSMAALDAALDIFDDVDLAAVKRKADQLFEVFVTEASALAPELTLLTPTDPERRGSQVSFRFREACPAIQALMAAGVIGDFRQPDVMRFGFAPLYLSHTEVWRAAALLGHIMQTRAWENPELGPKARVV